MAARNRIWLLVVVIAGIGVIALGYLLGISPKLAEIKAADDARAEALSTNETYEQQNAALKKDFEGIADIEAQLAELNVQLPADAGYDSYLAVITTIAGLTGTGATDITWGTPALVTADSAAFIAASGATPTGETAPVEPETTGVAPNGSLVGLPWSITVRGNLSSLQAFIGAIQRTDRLFLVTGYSLTADTGELAASDGYTLVLDGSTFVLVNNVPEEPVADAATE